MANLQNVAGYSKITADGAIGGSGNPVDVYGYSIESGAGGAGVVTFYDGTSTSDTKLFEDEGTSNKWKNVNYDVGRRYPNGIYLDIDTNVTSVVVWYNRVR